MAQVEPDSAAARAGIKAGDVIQKYNGNPIADAGQLSVQVNATAPGEKATLDIMRDGKPMTLTATIGSASSATRGQERRRRAGRIASGNEDCVR